MRPIDRIRLDPAQVRRELELRGFEAPLDRIIESDRTVRELRTQVETLQAERNRASKGGPPGKGETENVEVRRDPVRDLGFPAKPHWEIGEALGILDIPRGAKLSGSRFCMLRGPGAALQRALIAWMIDLKVARGFTEVYPPFVTKRETLVATGQLPHFDANLYRDAQDDLWLIPTAEPQLGG